MNKNLSPDLSALSFLRDDLKKLEKFLESFTSGTSGILSKAIRSTLNAGGKRIRPSLLFICAKNDDYDIDYLLPAAAAIEIIHTASLIHDDIIDRSLLRRGKSTIHHIYDNDTAKYVGDYLFTHTFSLLNQYKNARMLIEMSDAANHLVRGEFDQLKTKKDLGQSEDVYFKKINEKTSSLFKLSCVLGCILSGSSEKDIESMRRFGEFVGISFQINDDLIDIDLSRNSLKIGKSVGNDFRQGNITLPLIYAMQDRGFKKKIALLANKKEISEQDLVGVLKSLESTDAIEKTKQKFFYFLNEARKTVGTLEGKKRRESLLVVCDVIQHGKELIR